MISSPAILHALTGFGIGLGMTITAEGVEEGNERDALLRLGCHQGHGFLFSRAVPAADTAAFFRSGPESTQPTPAA